MEKWWNMYIERSLSSSRSNRIYEKSRSKLITFSPRLLAQVTRSSAESSASPAPWQLSSTPRYAIAVAPVAPQPHDHPGPGNMWQHVATWQHFRPGYSPIYKHCEAGWSLESYHALGSLGSLGSASATIVVITVTALPLQRAISWTEPLPGRPAEEQYQHGMCVL